MSVLGMTFAPWLVLALLACSVAVTLLANWLVASRRLAVPSAGEGVASLVWMALLFVGGLFAARYAERFAAAYLLYGLVAFLLSLLRAWLYRRSTTPPRWRPIGRAWCGSSPTWWAPGSSTWRCAGSFAAPPSRFCSSH